MKENSVKHNNSYSTTLVTFYHLSKNKLSSTSMTPRVPKSDYEDQTTPRICMSNSIQGCLIGINEDKDITGKKFYVYFYETNEYYKPSSKEVKDVSVTGEVWILKPITLSYKGIVEITGIKGYKTKKFNGKFHKIPQYEYKFL